MKKLLQDAWRKDPRGLAALLCLNMALALTGGVSTVMLVPMLDLLEVNITQGTGLAGLMLPFAGLSYTARALLLAAVFVALLLTRALLNRMASVRQNAFLERYAMGLRTRLYDAMAGADWQTLSQHRQTDLVNLLLSQTRQAQFCLSWIISLFASAASAALQLAIALWMSLLVTLMVLAVGGGFLWAFRPFLKKSKAYGEKSVEVSRQLYREVHDQLTGVKEIRAYGVEEAHGEKFHQVSREYYDTSLQVTQLRVVPQLCYGVAAALLIALAFVVSVLVLDTGTGQLMILVYIFSRLWPVFSSWQGQLQNIQSYLPAYDKICTTLEELEGAASAPGAAGDALPFEKEVRFDGVAFRYRQSGEEVLRNLSFCLPYGSITALAGKSGAGKSTTADLLLGLLLPTEGEILVDGVALCDENLRRWRRAVGYVPQDPLIRNATVRENLAAFHPEATEEEMIEALGQAQAWDFVEKLEHGLDTLLGDKGVRLSGGQRQRLVLARVLMGKPRLIILDEATSALDYESESVIREAIQALGGRTTVLIIAHRLATIRGAQRAIVIQDGCAAESGPLEELLNKKDGYLARMVSIE